VDIHVFCLNTHIRPMIISSSNGFWHGHHRYTHKIFGMFMCQEKIRWCNFFLWRMFICLVFSSIIYVMFGFIYSIEILPLDCWLVMFEYFCKIFLVFVSASHLYLFHERFWFIVLFPFGCHCNTKINYFLSMIYCVIYSCFDIRL